MLVVLTSSAHPEMVFRLEPGVHTIGRSDQDEEGQPWMPEVDLDALDHDAKVSRKHAVIRVTLTGVTIEDVGSLNGTFINRGSRLPVAQRTPLKSGDELAIGSTFLKVVLEAS